MCINNFLHCLEYWDHHQLVEWLLIEQPEKFEGHIYDA